MANDVSRIVGSLFKIPLGAVFKPIHQWVNGHGAVLELTVDHLDTTMVRQNLVHRVRRVAMDPGVAAILLRIDNAPGSWAACQDLREAIRIVRAAGKKVYAFLEAPGNAQMWIASACDRLFIVPTSEVGVVGVGAELTFFGHLLQNLGVTPDFEAAGAYKSFGEPFTRTFASPENQEAVRALIDDLHDQLVDGIAAGRELDRAKVDALLARAPVPAAEAVAEGLIDQIAYEDELESWLDENHPKAKRLRFSVWAGRDAVVEWIDSLGTGGGIVSVLHLEGPIVMDSQGTSNQIRARRVLPILRKLRESSRVSAVVLHVNSPGGSALASDMMWREVEKLQREKPVVAVFEDVSASGGFYLSAPAAEILARPATLTGSIGVFGGKLVVGEGLRKAGVNTQEISAAPNATMLSPTRPFTDGQRERFKESLQRFYDGFVQRVAAGRRRPEEAIEPHCRGRVWTGRDALKRGLVDRYGDLYDGVERARVLAGLHPGGFVRRDLSAAPPQSVLTRMIGNAMKHAVPLGGASLQLVERLFGARISAGLQVVLDHPAEPLALLPWDIDIR